MFLMSANLIENVLSQKFPSHKVLLPSVQASRLYSSSAVVYSGAEIAVESLLERLHFFVCLPRRS